MNKADLTAWFMDEFWPLYLVLVKTPFPTKYKQGNRGQALQKMLSVNPSAALRERMLASLSAQIKHRKELYDSIGSMEGYMKAVEYQKLYANRHAATWLNQMGWEDEIPSSVEQKDIEIDGNKICAHEDCGEHTMGPSIAWCLEHYPDTQNNVQMLREHLETTDLWKRDDETLAEWRERCKRESRAKLKSLIGR